MANNNTSLTEAERKQRVRESQKRYRDKKAAEKRANRPLINLQEIPVNRIEDTRTTPNTTTNVLFENLKQSYEEKCKQFDALHSEFKRIFFKTMTDGEAAKQFLKTAMIGLELLFPTQNKGGQN